MIFKPLYPIYFSRRKEDADKVYLPSRASQEDFRKQGAQKQKDVVLDAGMILINSWPQCEKGKQDIYCMQLFPNTDINSSLGQRLCLIQPCRSSF